MAPCLAYEQQRGAQPLRFAVSSGTLEISTGASQRVYNVILGFGNGGVPLVEHPDVAGVTFTGSPGTAREISARVATSLKRTSFELGGKSANIIFADSDLKRAVPAAAASIFMNSGQACVAGSRILVQRPIYPEFLKAFENAAGAWKAGDPFDRTTRLGPLVHKRQYDRVMGYLELAR